MERKKLKKILSSCASVLIGLTMIGAMSALFKARDEPEDVSTSLVGVTAYSISYYAVEKGKVVDVYPSLFKPGGSYPTSYVAGEYVYIDDLEEIIFIGKYEDRMFLGWYMDEACTQKYENGKKGLGDLTLYAKLSVGYWTEAF